MTLRQKKLRTDEHDPKGKSARVNAKEAHSLGSFSSVPHPSLSGELFCFDHTRRISTQSAEDIAAAAQVQRQQDDVTVLSLTFVPAEVLLAEAP